jgi:hypothetical protein
MAKAIAELPKDALVIHNYKSSIMADKIAKELSKRKD